MTESNTEMFQATVKIPLNGITVESQGGEWGEAEESGEKSI